MKIIEINKINKKFGKTGVLYDLSVSFECGLCYMIIGANGVGKSTFLKCLLGISKINSGMIKRNYNKLGYVPEKIILPSNVRVVDFLNLLGLLKGMTEEEVKIKLDFELNRWNLVEKRNSKIGSLSKGMTQKIVIIQALLNNPNLIVLDEVLNGLDVGMQKMLFGIIKEMKKRGATIILTSHYPKQYNEVVDEVLEINAGKIKKVQQFNEMSL